MKKIAESYIDYQARATEFNVGDIVMQYGLLESQAGRVMAVWPGIGMVDVENALGNKRYPIEELTRLTDSDVTPPSISSAPGRTASAKRVASYWAQKNRKFRLTRSELESKTAMCPRCSVVALKKTTYSRADGINERLLGCPSCMFLVKFEDIVNHWNWES